MQGDQLIAAMDRVSDDSLEWKRLYKAFAENTTIFMSASAAATQQRGIKYTSKGDFTHLPAVGSVSF